MFLSPILLIVVAIIVTLIFIKANTISFVVKWILLFFHSLKKNWMWIATIVIVAFGVFKWQNSSHTYNDENNTNSDYSSSSGTSNSNNSSTTRECKNCNGTGIAACPRCKGTGIDHFGSSTGDKCYCIIQYQNAIKKGRKPLHPPLRWECSYCGGDGVF